MLLVGLSLAAAACAGGEASPRRAGSPQDEATSTRHEAPAPARAPSLAPAPAASSPAAPPAPMAETDAERRARYEARYLEATLAVDAVLQRTCSACHGKAVADAPCGLRFDTHADLYVLRLVAPLSSDASSVVQAIVEGRMPPEGVEPRPDGAELEALRAFIDDPAFWSRPDDGSYDQAFLDAASNACDAGVPGE